MQAAFKKNLTNAQAEIDAATQEKRATARKAAAQNKQVIEDAKKRGQGKPMLYDNYNTGTARSNLAALKATKFMLETMEDSGIPRKQAEARLTPAQRTALEEERYVEARKKASGRY